MKTGESSQTHWDGVYRRTAPTEHGWFQAEPTLSLQLVREVATGLDTRILDAGGGTSRLVDRLLEAGYRNLGVLDISEAAIEQARDRLGENGSSVKWLVGDVTRMSIPPGWDIWHDRATFHFLVREEDRIAYMAALRRSLTPGGYAIIATFSPSGPDRCSGLPTVRYDAEVLGRVMGSGFELVRSVAEAHVTPGGREQDFLYCLFLRAG